MNNFFIIDIFFYNIKSQLIEVLALLALDLFGNHFNDLARKLDQYALI